MSYVLEDVIEAVAKGFTVKYPNVFYIHIMRSFVEWNEELGAWVVLFKKDVERLALDIIAEFYNEAIDRKEPSFIKMAISLEERGNLSKVLRRLRDITSSPIRMLSSPLVVEE